MKCQARAVAATASAQPLERMKAQVRSRPISATLLGVILGWLGVAGLLNAVGWPLLRNSQLFVGFLKYKCPKCGASISNDEARSDQCSACSPQVTPTVAS